ncbi:MAG: 30S ribosomal protein S2 [bacterium]
MAVISMKQLLEAGAHFGHQTKRWHPKMTEYIFGQRNGIHIIDLQKTVKKIKEAYKFVRDTVASGQTIVFVGTKKQAQEPLAAEATRCGMFYVNQRWVGGTLTNFATVKTSIRRLEELEKMKKDGEFSNYSKKDAAKLEKERVKLGKVFSGLKGMIKLPGALFVIDSGVETIAVAEANKLEIPLVAVVDTNCDPDHIDYIIPGNDDAIRAIKLMSSIIADAVLEGSQVSQDKAGETAKGEVSEEAFLKGRAEEPIKLGADETAGEENVTDTENKAN